MPLGEALDFDPFDDEEERAKARLGEPLDFNPFEGAPEQQFPIGQVPRSPQIAPPGMEPRQAPEGERGIDFSRPILDNPDGTFSTEETIGIRADIGDGEKSYVIPTIINGRRVSDEVAQEEFFAGRNEPVGVFNTEEEANAYAPERSNRIGNARQVPSAQMTNVKQSENDDLFPLQNRALPGEPAVLQELSRRLLEELAQNPSDDRRREAERQLQELRRSLQAPGQADPGAMRGVREPGLSDAPRGLQPTASGDMAVPSVPPGPAQEESGVTPSIASAFEEGPEGQRGNETLRSIAGVLNPVHAISSSIADAANGQGPTNPFKGFGPEMGRATRSIPGSLKEMYGGARQYLGEQTRQEQEGETLGAKVEEFFGLPRGVSPERRKAAEERVETGRRIAAEGRSQNERFAPSEDRGIATSIAGDIIRTSPYLGGSLATAALTKNPILGAGVLSTGMAAQQYGEARAKGRSEAEAAQDATWTAFAEGVPELLPLGIAIKSGTPFLKRIFYTALGEAPSESITEALEVGYNAGVLGEYMPLTEALAQIGYAGVVGFFAGGLMGTAAHPVAVGVREEEPPPTGDQDAGLGPEAPNGRPGEGERGGEGQRPPRPREPSFTDQFGEDQLSDTIPELSGDVAAQIAALADPRNLKDSVFVTSENARDIPGTLPDNVQRIDKPSGVLLTTNDEKATRFREGVDERGMAEILDYPVSKTDAIEGGNVAVVQALDEDGNVVYEAETTQEGLDETTARAQQQVPPGGRTNVVTPQEALQRRFRTSPGAISAEHDAEVSASEAEGFRQAAMSTPEGQAIEEGAAQAETRPTRQQVAEDNYQKGPVEFQGIPIDIETPRGVNRTGTDQDGKFWEASNPRAHYGEFRRTEGADGDAVDVLIGPRTKARNAFVIDQYDPRTQQFDEHKVVLGAGTEAEARNIYDAGFSDNSGPMRRQSITQMPMEELKEWLKTGDTTKAAAFDPYQFVDRARQRIAGKGSIQPKSLAEALGIKPYEAQRVLAAILATPNPPIRMTKKGVARKPIDKGDVGVLKYVARKGGISDKAKYDLEGLRQFIPGAGPLVRSNGRPLDEIGEDLWQEGHFGPPATTPRPTEDEVFEYLQSANRGERDLPPEQWAEKVQAMDNTLDDADAAEAYMEDKLRKRAEELGVQVQDNWDADDLLVAITEKEAVMAESGEDVGDAPVESETDADLYLALTDPYTYTQAHGAPENVLAASPAEPTGGREPTAEEGPPSAPKEEIQKPGEGVPEYRPDVEGEGAPSPEGTEPVTPPKGTEAFLPADKPKSPAFFSALTRAVENTRQPKAPGAQWQAIIKNAPGVKREEIEWSGVNEWLADKKSVTKDDLLQFLSENEVRVEEVEKGGSPIEEELRPRDAISLAERGEDIFYRTSTMAPGEDAGPIGVDEIQRLQDQLGTVNVSFHKQTIEGATKFASYTLPGGELYRELLLTLPSGENTQEYQALRQERARLSRTPGSGGGDAYARIDAIDRELEAIKDQAFTGGHFDEPNVLAHVRFDDRTTADGKKALHIAEIQSDLHQKGRRHGYRNEEAIKEFDAYSAELAAKYDLNPQQNLAMYGTMKNMDPAEVEKYERLQNAAFQGQGGNQVPDFPFKQSWQNLALKRMIRYASENGYDVITWDTGEIQADRYDLSKQIDTVDVLNHIDGGRFVDVRKDGKSVFDAKYSDDGTITDSMADFEGKNLSDVLGKDIADKILAIPKDAPTPRNRARVTRLEGLDLKVGGEGMRGFYDKILPAFANKYVKKWGTKVGDAELSTDGLTDGQFESVPIGSLTDDGTIGPVHALPITESMRKSAMEGQPLFQPTDKGTAKVSEDRRAQAVDLTDVLGADIIPTPLYDENEAEFADAIKRIVKRLAPHARVEAAQRLYILGEHGSGVAGEARGATYQRSKGTGKPLERVIAYAMDHSGTPHTVRHEAMHAIEEDILNPKQRKTLHDAAEKNGWVENHEVLDRWPGYKDNPLFARREAIAEEFAHWRNHLGKLPGAIQPIFAKIDLFLRNVARMVRRVLGRPATYKDLFTQIEGGRMQRRQGAEVGAWSPGEDPLQAPKQGKFATEPGAVDAKGRPLPQNIIPGMERSAKQAAKAREGKIKPKAGQKDADEGLFADPNKGQTELFLPSDAKELLSPNATGPRSRSAVGGKGGSVNGARRALKKPPPLPKSGDYRFVKRTVLDPYQIATKDPEFVGVFDQAMQFLRRRNEAQVAMGEAIEPYMKMSEKQRHRINMVLEHGRLSGEDYSSHPNIQITNRLHDTAMLPVGDTIKLTEAERQGYLAVRKAMDRALLMIKQQALIEAGLGQADQPRDPESIREMAEHTVNKTKKNDLKRAADLVEEIEYARRAGYVPFSRYGDYGITVTDQLGGVAHFEKIDIRDTKTGRFLGKRKVTKARERLLKQYPRSRGFTVQNTRLMSPLDTTGIEDMDFALHAELAKAGGADQKMIDAVEEAARKGWTKQGFRSHFIESKNVPGYETDFTRSLSDYIIGQSGYLARRATMQSLDDAVANIPNTKPQLKKYAKDYRNYLLNPQEEFGPWRGLMFFSYLAGNISSAVLNLTQVPIFTFPFLTMVTNSPRAAAELTKASATTLAMFRPQKKADALNFDIAKAPEDIREDLQTLMREGDLVPMVTLENMGVAQGRKKFLRGMGGKTKAVMEAAGTMFTAAERFNRIASAVAAIRLAQRPGVLEKADKAFAKSNVWKNLSAHKNRPEPIDLARFVLYETHFVFGKANRPKAMRGPGAILLQFQSFTWRALQARSRMAHLYGPAGKKAYALNSMMLIMGAGLLGLPFADDLKDLIESLYYFFNKTDLDIEKEMQDFAVDAFGDEYGPMAGEMLRRGPLRASGVDMSQRIGMGQVSPVQLPPPTYTQSRALQAMAENFGIPGSVFATGLRALDSIMEGDISSGVSELSRFVVSAGGANALRSLAMKEEGLRTRAGALIIHPDDLSASDIWFRAFGFQSSRIARRYETDWMKTRIANATSELQTQFYRKYARAVVSGVDGAVDEVNQEIDDWNEGKAQEYQIRLTPQTIRRHIQQERTGRSEMQERAAPRRARGAMREVEEIMPEN